MLIDIIKRQFIDDTYKFNMDIKLIQKIADNDKYLIFRTRRGYFKMAILYNAQGSCVTFPRANGTFPHILVYVCRSKFTKL